MHRAPAPDAGGSCTAGLVLPAPMISCGVSCRPEHAQSPDALVRCADVALYAAKASGRNRAVAFDPAGACGPRSCGTRPVR